MGSLICPVFVKDREAMHILQFSCRDIYCIG
jgi:hypothetical protein